MYRMVMLSTINSDILRSASVMAIVSNVSPTDLATALQKLTLDETKELLFYLKVPLHLMNSVSTHQSVNMCKISYIQLLIDHDPELSWEKIVAGLEQIGKKALANEIAVQYCARSSLVKDGPRLPLLFSPHPLP